MSTNEPSKPSDDDAAVPEKLERFVDAIPEPQRNEFREVIREFLGVVHSKSTSPFDISPEVAQILSDAQIKDNDNKFKFATQKQTNSHEFKMVQHRDRFKILRPIVFTIATVLTVCLFLGIYLAINGHETLGSCILTGVITAILSYLAGLGTADLVKGE